MQNLMIGNIEIRQDAEGRFCLNDLHRAAGGESRHQPGKWLNNQRTQDLINEIKTDTGNPVTEQNQPLRIVQGGSGQQGTFACKELIYDYAMWISPAFNLKVIRAYDSMVSPQPQPVLPAQPYDMLSPYGKAKSIATDMLDIYKLFNAPVHISQQEAVKEVRKTVGLDLSPALTHSPDQDDISKDEEMLEPTELGKLFNISAVRTNKILEELGLQIRRNGEWMPSPEGSKYSIRHAWSKMGKSGYNLKWRVADIQEMFEDYFME